MYARGQKSEILLTFIKFQVGRMDPESETFSGRDVIYIYPDLHTAIIGRYDNGTMILGYMCYLKAAFLDPETNMMQVTVTGTFGPKMKKDISTSTIIGNFPLVPDLYEAEMVEVQTSGIGNHAGKNGFYVAGPPATS